MEDGYCEKDDTYYGEVPLLAAFFVVVEDNRELQELGDTPFDDDRGNSSEVQDAPCNVSVNVVNEDNRDFHELDIPLDLDGLCDDAAACR
mmetsp:Transcript_14874/g.41422  ORF Transcript_14874/g.41422 Transcript_14874/m.41422 type:complete len:90 (+) Transcript_14874:2320-2589(+)